MERLKGAYVFGIACRNDLQDPFVSDGELPGKYEMGETILIRMDGAQMHRIWSRDSS